jgi:hypothetical protein
MTKILFIQDIYDLRNRKQEELAFYHLELEKLQLKMNYIRVEMDLTNRIIDMIENENVTDLRDWLKPESAKR